METFFLFSTTEVSTSELWKEHEFKPGLVRNPPWQGLDDGEEDFGDDGRVVVKCARPARPDGALHRGIEALVIYSLEGRPHAEFKKAQAECIFGVQLKVFKASEFLQNFVLWIHFVKVI